MAIDIDPPGYLTHPFSFLGGASSIARSLLSEAASSVIQFGLNLVAKGCVSRLSIWHLAGSPILCAFYFCVFGCLQFFSCLKDGHLQKKHEFTIWN
jgi:hypothetical protein